jgi:hypothetical protein
MQCAICLTTVRKRDSISLFECNCRPVVHDKCLQKWKDHTGRDCIFCIPPVHPPHYQPDYSAFVLTFMILIIILFLMLIKTDSFTYSGEDSI